MLAEIIQRDPGIMNRDAIAAFKTVSGLLVTRTTIQKCRRKIGLTRPQGYPKQAVSIPFSAACDHAVYPDIGDDNLSSRERSILFRIMDDHPDVSPIEVVAMLANEVKLQRQ